MRIYTRVEVDNGAAQSSATSIPVQKSRDIVQPRMLQAQAKAAIPQHMLPCGELPVVLYVEILLYYPPLSGSHSVCLSQPIPFPSYHVVNSFLLPLQGFHLLFERADILGQPVDRVLQGLRTRLC